jgi:hypothetical protein
MQEKIYDVECEACGNKGKVKNVYNDDGKFECCQCTDTVYLVEIEGYSIPVCKKCDAVM